jgi:hypothetical protein
MIHSKISFCAFVFICCIYTNLINAQTSEFDGNVILEVSDNVAIAGFSEVAVQQENGQKVLSLNYTSVFGIGGAMLSLYDSTNFIIGNNTGFGIVRDGLFFSPRADLHIKQTDKNRFLTNMEVLDGIVLEEGAHTWRMATDRRISLPNPFGGGFTTRGGDLKFYNGIPGSDTLMAIVSNVDGSWIETSDLRLKKEIQYFSKDKSSILGKVNALKPCRFKYLRNSDDDKYTIGFIAQEVIEYFPELVSIIGENGEYGISYSKFGPIAIAAIQEQQDMIDQQKDIINQQQEQINLLIKKMATIEKKLR